MKANKAEFSTREDRFAEVQTIKTPGVKIWIDINNTPHVPFFIPVIRELKRRGHEVLLSARDAYQVCELADKMKLSYVKIGHHYGKNKILKIFGLLWRSFQLAPFYFRERPQLAIAHGSRSLFLFCNLFRIPSIVVMDYEHGSSFPLSRPRWGILPEALSGSSPKNERLRYYRGIKEDVYVPEFKPDPSLLDDLGLRPDDIIVTVRPPASEAHYHRPESDFLLQEIMLRICRTPGIQAVLLPRNYRQGLAFTASHPEWFMDRRTIIPPRVVDGLNLLWFSDLAISGGGTMNREAAALGIPVYSIFRGKMGAVDRMLEQQNRLTVIPSREDIWTKIRLVHRDKKTLPDNQPRAALEDIVNHIEEIIRNERLCSCRGALIDPR